MFLWSLRNEGRITSGKSGRKGHARLVETCLLSLCWQSEWGFKKNPPLVFSLSHSCQYFLSIKGLPVIHFPLCSNGLSNSGCASGAR